MTRQSTLTYHIKPQLGMLRHMSGWQPLCRDSFTNDVADDNQFARMDDAEMLLNARIRSGDYFVALAGELEQITERLASADSAHISQLHAMVKAFEYLDDHYLVVPKKT